MFLVVMGHVTTLPALINSIYSFHMPLFFFASGLLFKDKAHFLSRHIRSFGIPYFVFCFLSFAYWFFLERTFRKTEADPLEQFIGIFYPAEGATGYVFNGVLWFLPCLFVVRIMFNYLYRYTAGYRQKAMIVTLIVLLIFDNFVKWDAPFFLSTALSALPFLIAGYLLQPCQPKMEYLGSKYGKSSLAIALILLVCIWLIPVKLFMYAKIYSPNYITAFACAFLGIMMCMCLSTSIKRNPPFEWIGRNSLVIMCCHVPLLRLIIVAYARITGQMVDVVRDSILQSAFLSCLTIICLIPVVYVMNRWLYMLLGRVKQTSTSK